jgi:hypothetical protein
MKLIRIFDNGGRTCDRYTVVIGTSVYGMSDNPTAPNGFNQYCGEVYDLSPDLFEIVGTELHAIPACLELAIEGRMNW